MKLDFFKMQAQGNDYIFFDFLENPLPEFDYWELSGKICDRNFGIGADGIVLILPNAETDASMRIFNANGSEAEMCGSALRCLTWYLSNKKAKKELAINTKSGIKTGKILDNPEIPTTEIMMGTASFIETEPVIIHGFKGYLISVGNPHFVCFVDDLTENYARNFGNMIEQEFPRGINVHFVQTISRNSFEMRIWERGSGITLACGTGACAAFFAGLKRGIFDDSVTALMPGGKVSIRSENDTIFLSGKVEFVFSGKMEL